MVSIDDVINLGSKLKSHRATNVVVFLYLVKQPKTTQNVRKTTRCARAHRLALNRAADVCWRAANIPRTPAVNSRILSLNAQRRRV